MLPVALSYLTQAPAPGRTARAAGPGPDLNRSRRKLDTPIHYGPDLRSAQLLPGRTAKLHVREPLTPLEPDRGPTQGLTCLRLQDIIAWMIAVGLRPGAPRITAVRRGFTDVVGAGAGHADRGDLGVLRYGAPRSVVAMSETSQGDAGHLYMRGVVAIPVTGAAGKVGHAFIRRLPASGDDLFAGFTIRVPQRDAAAGPRLAACGRGHDQRWRPRVPIAQASCARGSRG